jgi:methyl-accepting chemotaxis protein
MLASLHTMTGNLRGMLLQVQQSSGELSRASADMAAACAGIRSGAEDQYSQAQESAALIEEMAASIRTVADNAVTMTSRAESTGATVAELGSSVQSVAQGAVTLSAAVEQTSSSIQQMGASIGEIARVSQVQLQSARGAEEGMRRIADTIRLVGESLSEADRIAGSSRTLGQEGAEAARRANASMQKMTETVRRTAASVREVSSHSSEIESILGVIEEIADQTNLLALNAAILAAQAGEHGRGFGVVAKEVRSLANRSSASAREIGGQIATIIERTREAVAVAEETLRETEQSAGHTHVAGEALEGIVAGTDQTAAIVGRINDSGREQGRISAEAMEAVRGLGEISAQVSRSAEELQSAGGLIRKSAQSMSDVNRQVVNATGEQANQSRMVVREVQEMNALIRQVSNATVEQSKGSAAMTAAITRIAEVASRNTAAARTLTATTDQLAGQAEKLRQAAEAFRT